MSERDPYGLFGEDDEEPGAKRRSEGDEDDPYGLFGDDAPARELAEVRGIPAGPEPPPRGRQLREPEDPSLLRELGKSALSFAEGASFNTADEAAAVATYLGNAFGLNDDARELGDITADYNARARNLAREYPYGHAAGRVASGLALGLAGPSGIAAQAAIAGTSGALNEYADSRDLKRTALAAGVDTALAGAGTWGANRLARGLATSSDTAKRRALEEAFGQRGAPPPRPPPTEAPLPPVPETPRPLPMGRGPAYDPYAGGVGAQIPETPRPLPGARGPGYDPYAGGAGAQVPEAPRPQLNPPEMAYGSYDPLAAQTNPTLARPPGPALLEAPEAEASMPVVRSAIEMLAPSLQSRTTEAGLREWAEQVTATNLPPEAERALLAAWSRRLRDVAPDADPSRMLAEVRLGTLPEEVAASKVPKYALGELEAPVNAAPRPRLGDPASGPPNYSIGDLLEEPASTLARPRTAGGREPGASYALGDVPGAPAAATPRPRVGGPAVLPEGPSYTPGPFPDVPLVHEPVPRVGGLPADISATERELKQIALRRARAEMPQSLSGRGLDFLGKFPGATGKTARIANAARRGITGDASEYAIEKGWLAPNERVATGMRILDRTSAPFSKDAVEKTAYGDADTLNYALSATLHAGNTGLSPEDEQALTEAVVRGDQSAINAADFRLRQRYPAYARRVERELRALNEDQ
jgi:hypothetical protein